MAGQAEKKQAKRAENLIVYFLYAMVGVNALYVLSRVLFYWSSWGKWNIIGFALFSFVSYFTYNGIDRALQIGGDYEWFQDMFIVNLTTQLLVCFSDYGWLLYLLVPGYLGWKVLKMFLSYVFTPTEAEMNDNDPKNKKKMEKQQKKAERPKFKSMK
mmetsp:Transcript_74545/g.242019  ORF Transcript_74545/g.242019 Transcript_74545/m.242019 type:complete len:157 (-) Transcript_74545:124-594(-)